MNRKETFSSEALNAFIDNQLSADEKTRIYTTMEQDNELSHYLCRLRTTHELVRDAYDPALLPPLRPTSRQPSYVDRLCRIAAVVLLFIAGGITGWLGHSQLKSETGHSSIASIDSINTQTYQNVLLHINSGNPAHIDAALNDAQQLLHRARKEGKKLQLEILANEDGIKLLNAKNSAFASRIAVLKHNYQNISFTACAKTLQRLKEKGVNYELVPQAQVVSSALDEIVGRMEKGWVYIRV